METKAKKAKQIFEWTFIGLFIAIVVLIISVIAYKNYTQTDMYKESVTKRNFETVLHKLQKKDNVISLRVDKKLPVETGEAREEVFKNIPEDVFDDLVCHDYQAITDPEEKREIFAGECIIVYFKDNTYTTFYVASTGQLYWGTTLAVQCPSLMYYYYEVNS